MCEHILGITPSTEDEKPQRPHTQADKWMANLTVRQFCAREGHLNVPRKHIETVLTEEGRADQHRLGAWINNQRSKAAGLTPERVKALLDRDAVVVRGSADTARHRSGRLKWANQPDR